MMLITCPCCGPRDVTEFTYGGDASVRRPASVGADTLTDEQWADAVYLRDNPRGAHVEWWQHNYGCRRWIAVQRNTLTHDVISSRLPGETAP